VQPVVLAPPKERRLLSLTIGRRDGPVLVFDFTGAVDVPIDFDDEDPSAEQ